MMWIFQLPPTGPDFRGSGFRGESTFDMGGAQCPFVDGKYGLGAHATKAGSRVTIRMAAAADAGAILGLIKDLAVYEKEPVSTVDCAAGSSSESRVSRDSRL